MRGRVHWLAQSLVAATVLAALVFGPAPAGADDRFPTDPAAAMALYEGDVDGWADGPVGWILLEDETDLWDTLRSTADRRAFIDWFWARRDPDLRDDRNEFREGFYARVAEANERYHEFPRGWKSDRGRVHAVLGRPNAIQPHMGGAGEAVVWTYYTVGPGADDLPVEATMGEFSIAFTRTNMRTGYEIYGGFGGPGTMPLYVRDALQYAKEGAVVNPDLEAPRASSADVPGT